MKKHAWETLLLLWITGCITAVAQPREMDELDAIANSVFTQSGARATSVPLKMSLKSSDILKPGSLTGGEAFYIYTPSTGNHNRFVIVSGDKRMPAVLGYSDESNFDLDHISDGLKWFLGKCGEEARLVALYADNDTITNDTTEFTKWPIIEPLLGKRAWGQGYPFNLKCPTIGNQQAMTGCVATALAQIMAYHRYPAHYDWDLMLDSYDEEHTPNEADAVAQLMYEIGKACNMMYGTTVSLTGDYNAEAALLDSLFNYDDEVRLIKKEYYSEEAWHEIIVRELCEGRPVFYDGTNAFKQNGHAFVVDGLDCNGYFHINWGWNGDHNGYFLLDKLSYTYTNEYGNPEIKDYSYNSDALIHIRPNDCIAEREPTNIVSDSIVVKDGVGTFPKNSTIELAIFNFTNMRNIMFKGERQLLLMDYNTDSLITPLGNATSMKTSLPTGASYTNALKIRGTLPKDLPNGAYRIYAGVRQSGYEEWGRVTAPILNGDKILDHYIVMVKNDFFTIGTGEAPSDLIHIEANTLDTQPQWAAIHPTEERFQFTPHITLNKWDIISTIGATVTQGGYTHEGSTTTIHALPAGIYILRGFSKEGTCHILKFIIQ